MNLSLPPAKVLDFDIEARPLSWLGGDFVTREPTAIAAGWVGEEKIHCWALGEVTALKMLREFRRLYDAADIVTGHYIRGYDLSTLSGAMVENGLPPLGPKLVQDTKTDLVKMSGISKSQESLAAMLDVDHPKIGMSQRKWREANRLTAEGIRHTKQRCIGDVRQHKEMRAKMLELGLLRPPRRWSPHQGAG